MSLALQDISNPRDVREFIEARRRSGVRIKINVFGAGQAECSPSSNAEFERLRSGLRMSKDFVKPSEQIDRLADTLRRKRGVGLPLPKIVFQHSDSSIGLSYGDLTIRAFAEGLVAIIAGGFPVQGIKPELIDALAHKAAVK